MTKASKTRSKLTAAEAAAIVRLGKEKGVAELARSLKPGTYEVTTNITLSGLIGKGEPTQATQNARVPWEAIATALLDRVAPATKEAVINQVMAQGGSYEPTKAQVKALVQTLKNPQQVERAGRLTGVVVGVSR